MMTISSTAEGLPQENKPIIKIAKTIVLFIDIFVDSALMISEVYIGTQSHACRRTLYRAPNVRIWPDPAGQAFCGIISATDPKETGKLKTVAAGIAIGTAIGAGVGVAMGNIGAGIAIGIAIGAAVGASRQKKGE